MRHKVWLVVAAVVLLPLQAPPMMGAEYTVVMKDGQRYAAREKYVIEGDSVRFIGSDGQAYRLPLRQVDLVTTTAANRNRPRKAVWTNDEVERGRLRGRINIVGAAAEQPKGEAAEAAAGEEAAGEVAEGEEREAGAETPAEKPQPALPREKDPEWYRDRLRPLRSELADVDRQIANLQRQVQTGGGGAQTGAVGLLQSNPGVDPRDTLARLQRRRQDIQQQIAAIEAEARRNGLSPGQIR